MAPLTGGALDFGVSLQPHEEAEDVLDREHGPRTDLSPARMQPVGGDRPNALAENGALDLQTSLRRHDLDLTRYAAHRRGDRQHDDESCRALIEYSIRHDEGGSASCLLMASDWA